MTEPPAPRRKPHPAVTAALVAVAIWILLAVCMGGNSLDRADKAASVIAMLLALGTFTVTILELQRRSSNTDTDTGSPGERPSLLKRPSVLAGLSAMGVGLLIVVCVGLAFGDDDPPEEAQPDAAGSTPAVVDTPATTAGPSESPSTTGPAEPCASPGTAVSPAPTASATSDAVRHDGMLILSKGYYADLDSLCPDWDVTDVVGTKQDIGNDGKGLTRSLSAGTQIAVVEKSAAATYEMCSSNTDYVSGVIRYEDLRPGLRYCVLTDKGRRSLVTVKRVRGGADRTTVHVEVRTWAEVRPSDETNYVPWIIGGIVVLMLLGGGAKSATTSKSDGE